MDGLELHSLGTCGVQKLWNRDKTPFVSRDDIVWRGQLAHKWLETNSNVVGHFGDVDLTFEVVEYRE